MMWLLKSWLTCTCFSFFPFAAVSGDTCSCVFGSCVDEGTTGLKKCQCQTGYTGLHCETGE